LVFSYDFQEIIDEPVQNGAEVVTKKSVIECPKNVESVSTGSNDNILVGGNKEQILELLRDRILTPRGYQGIEFDNFFAKAEWSLAKMNDGPLR
jgi:hypothetical protein